MQNPVGYRFNETTGRVELTDIWAVLTNKVTLVTFPHTIASALLTGNGVALIMRVPGTEHGDWWSTRGWPIFASTAAVAVLSKYVTRVGGRPLLNPSNGALVVAFLLFGSNLADPQDLWWGPWSLGLALTYVIIVGAGVALTRRIGTQRVVWPFVITYATSLAIVAASGHSMTARWKSVSA